MKSDRAVPLTSRTSETAPEPTTQATTKKDPVSQLLQLTKRYNLADPIYKINVSKGQIYYALVEVSSEKFSSYPKEAKIEKDAREMAAKEALDSMLQKLSLNNPINFKETIDENLIQKRISDIVQEHYGGVFENQMNSYYAEKYQENLPNRWLEIVKGCPNIDVECTKSKNVIVCATTKSSQIQPHLPENNTIPEKDLSESEPWPVFVTYVANTDSIWARLSDENSILFESLANEMNIFYNERKMEFIPKTIQAGKYYTYFEGDCWHRVKCERFDSHANIASIFFIDHGDKDNVNPKLLYTLVDKFLNLPAQAIRFSLFGLEDWSQFTDSMVIRSVEKYLLENQELFVNILCSQKGVKTAIFLQHGAIEINLNQCIFYELLQYCKTSEEALNTEKRIVMSTLSHVTEKGQVFLNVHTDSYKYFNGLYKKLRQNIPNPYESLQQQSEYIDTNKMYFTNKLDGTTWHRARIIDCKFTKLLASLQKEVTVFLIDHGATIRVSIKDLVPVENMSYILDQYPAQAVQVQLYHISDEMLVGMIDRFKELATDKLLTVKVIEQASKSSLATVQLFIRVSENNILASINNTLELEEHLNTIEPNNNGESVSNNEQSNAPKKRGPRSNDWLELLPKGNKNNNVLKPPKIPYDSETYFNVHVTLAANPNFFVIQPFESRNEFRELSRELNEDCVNEFKNCQGLTSDNIVEGNLYAAFHHKNKWCRVYVKNILNNVSVTVYFCDYGEIALCRISELLPLKDKFLFLPYQALRAKLFGVKPIDKDWSVEDIVYFNHLVAEKNLISIIMGISADTASDELVLKLKLIDTSTQKDIHIDEQLIEKNHATRDLVT